MPSFAIKAIVFVSGNGIGSVLVVHESMESLQFVIKAAKQIIMIV